MKLRYNILLGSILCLLCGLASAQSSLRVDPYYHILAAGENEDEQKWANYLQTQLERRMGQTDSKNTVSDPARSLEIGIDIVPNSSSDYTVLRHDNQLTLRAKNESVMLWVIYQCIAWLADADARIDVRDLPPAILDMGHAGEGTFRFEYRGVYSSANTDPDVMAIQASHNVDYDWGLWGHNLRKVVGSEPDDNLYAWHEQHRDSRQFCFSSEELFRRLETFILDNYGDGIHGPGARGSRFCIMPEDNSIVCLCDQCRKKGNIPQSATPAVQDMLSRLAERFPAHLFFTTAYLTTGQVPNSPMPENSGVIVSAIDLPLKFLSSQPAATAMFEQKLAEWRAVTSRIYVWDYMRNFDDYLTPFPLLYTLKERLAFFEKNGVAGVFYNGSGYDYASFDDLQTFVLSALLKCGNIDCDTLIRQYLHKFYPQSEEIIYPYYVALERKVLQNRALLPYYGGIEDAIKAYLDPGEFVSFYRKLSACSKTIDGEERGRLNRLLTAFDFTLLELMRTPRGISYDSIQIDDLLYDLQGHDAFPDMKNYREAHGSIESYLADWHSTPIRTLAPEGFSRHNLTFYDPADLTIGVLSDTYYALPSDYHTGWCQFKNRDLVAETQFSQNAATVVKGNFLYAPQWKIELPEYCAIYVNGTKVKEYDFESSPEPFSKHGFQFETELAAGDRLKIVVKSSPKAGVSVACDEIEVYEKN